ncbi:MAG: ribosome silencing factor [Muribaculaceae bacterium]|nr:ribosome silencing factor [Muribaculaceae bacterium]
MTATTDIEKLIIEGIQERKGRNITCIDLSDIESAATNGFIICEGTSTMHVSSIADSIREYLLEQARIKPYNYDGYQNSQWIVLDYGSIMVHVFVPDERQRYNLEELWNDGKVTEIPNLD